MGFQSKKDQRINAKLKMTNFNCIHECSAKYALHCRKEIKDHSFQKTHAIPSDLKD